MDAELYRGFSIWGHSIRQNHGFAASGTVTKQNQLVEASGVLGVFDTEEDAALAGLNWCRAWVDSHS
jgi:hypothetical protein